MSDLFFRHERLTCYQFAVEVGRWLRAAPFPPAEAELQKQAIRAADSIVLNLAEGSRQKGGNRQRHFRYAQGSAAEACAVLDIVALPDGPDVQLKLRRIAAMASQLR